MSTNINDYNFILPEENIAQRPVSPRDSSKLLYVNQNQPLQDQIFSDIVNILQKGDLLLMNNTKVLPAQLQGVRIRGDLQAKVSLTLHQKTHNGWKAFCRPAKKLNVNDIIKFSDDFTVKVLAKDGGEVSLEFPDHAEEKLTEYGAMPLPHYIKRKNNIADAQDKEDYQTIYAKHKGAVAAPTAGLHFTDNVLNALKDKGVDVDFVTLHVGAGTFLPVKVDDVNNHKMHYEYGELSPQVAEKIRQAKLDGRRIISVGTTTLRILESVATFNDGQVKAWKGETNIFITPGYEFKVIDALITNFHLPKSTLFMLVSAFMGLDKMQEVYAHAIQNNYRFFSYGDSSILIKSTDEK